MANINSVCITGNLTADPEVKNFDNGGMITSLRVAVNGGYKNRDSGEFVEQVSYFDVDVKNNQAQACADHLVKGRGVAVMGRLQQNRWETDEGNRSRVVIVSTNVQFLGAPNGEGNGNGAAASTTELPAGDPTPTAVAAGAGDDDIPF